MWERLRVVSKESGELQRARKSVSSALRLKVSQREVLGKNDPGIG